jgi:hypothetical protein
VQDVVEEGRCLGFGWLEGEGHMRPLWGPCAHQQVVRGGKDVESVPHPRAGGGRGPGERVARGWHNEHVRIDAANADGGGAGYCPDPLEPSCC